MITNNLKKRFCRDMGINIQLYSEPYFTERIELLGHKNDWDNLVNMINTKYNGNEEVFLEEYNRIKDNIIEYIQESEAYKALNKDDMNKYEVKTYISSNDIYKSNNIGKEFISIDMVKANFTSLVSYAYRNMLKFNSKEAMFSYDKFIREFTDNDYFIKSKYIRQVIFGACNPKRQVKYEKFIMNILLKNIIEYTSIEIKDIASFSNDEIVIEVNDAIREKLDSLRDLLIVLGVVTPLHFEYFRLGKVTNSDAYIKEVYYSKLYTKPDSYTSIEERKQNFDVSISLPNIKNNIKEDEKQYIIKKANPIDIIFISRILKNEEITENDLVFYHEGRLARLLEIPDMQIVFE